MKNYLCSQKEFGGNYRDRTKTDASTDAGVDPVKSSAITSPTSNIEDDGSNKSMWEPFASFSGTGLNKYQGSHQI